MVNKNYINIALFVTILVLLLLLLKTCSDLKKERQEYEEFKTVHENNIIAMKDSIKTYYDKELNRIINEKTIYLIKNIEDLNHYNSKLYNEFKNMKNLVAGIQSNIKIIMPSLSSSVNTVTVDSTDSTKYITHWNFNYKDDGLEQTLFGKTELKIQPKYCRIYNVNSLLESNETKINIKYSILEEKNKYIIRAYSPSSHIKFNELDGALVFEKPRHHRKKRSIKPSIVGLIDHNLKNFYFGILIY